jgi:hypothetical protein
MPSIKINPKGDNPTEIRRALQQLNSDLVALTASEIPSSPYGSISATNVQDALEELDDEKKSSLMTLTDVLTETPSDDSILQYNNSNSRFELTNSPVFLSGTITNKLFIGTNVAELYPFNDDLHLDLPANKTLVLDEIVYNDIYIGIESGRTSAANYPDWETFSTNLSAYTFDVDDYIDLSSVELLHGWKEGTDIELHVHWATNGVDVDNRYVKWQIFYSWADKNEVFSAEAEDSEETEITASTTDRTHKYTSVTVIAGTNYKIGSVLKLRLKRITSTGTAPTADPFALMVGVHYQIDTLGSRERSIK